jgi:Arc/MetJ-type ribon-helix-helix transcriptional regulator
MTEVVSFKATEKQVKELDKAVAEGGFTSRGEFLRTLLRQVEHKRLSEEAGKDIDEARLQKARPLDEIL